MRVQTASARTIGTAAGGQHREFHSNERGDFMKTVIAILALTAVAAAGQAYADQPAQEAHQPMRPVSECLRPDRINEWYVVDKRTAIVRTGPDRYLVKLQADCPRLGIGQSLRFRANESNKVAGLGAICGEAGETVRSRDQPPCAIQSVGKIDKAQFDQLEATATQHGFMGKGSKTPKP
jgi:hypothetical protein